MGKYSIKEIAALSGIKAHTLRIWEQRYKLIEPKRTDTNIRFYSDEQLKFVLNISFLNQNGHKISRIAAMSAQEILDEVDRLSITNIEFANQIQALSLCMVDLDEGRFEKIMATNIMQIGFEKTMIKIVFPFLERVGTLWSLGAISPAHEHFISNLIRQKLMVAIDGVVVKSNGKCKKILTYLPEGELHEIGLLFCQYILKSRDHDVIHLGASVPFEDLAVIGKIHHPDIIFSILTIPPVDHTVEEYTQKLSLQFSKSNIFLCGQQMKDVKVDHLVNVSIISSLSEFPAIVDEFSLLHGNSGEIN